MGYDKRGHAQALILAGQMCHISDEKIRADALTDVPGLTVEEFDQLLAEVENGDVSKEARAALTLATAGLL